jgi:hypothetical protein
MRVLPALGLVASTSLLLPGCGPVLSVWLVSDAEAKLAAARAAEAETNAVYEFTAAQAYLTKAHEELGYADYGPAIDYAFKASKLAAQGAERARETRGKTNEEAGPGAAPAPPTRSGPGSAPPASPGVTIKKAPSATAAEGNPE